MIGGLFAKLPAGFGMGGGDSNRCACVTRFVNDSVELL